MLRPVELLALLYGSDLEVSPADEDVYVRAFPRPVTQTSSRISLHSLFGERLWPDFHRLERCRYGLRTLLVNSETLGTAPSCTMFEVQQDQGHASGAPSSRRVEE